MKKIIPAIVFIASVCNATAQRAATDIFPYRTDPEYQQKLTLIDGEFIRGVPFLDPEWRQGSVTLKNGTVYTQYKLKYNNYDQEILFLDGKDSLAISDPIKGFSITDMEGKTHNFVNADNYQKISKPAFYEVLLEDTKGSLLKLHRTLVAASSELSNAAGERHLYGAYEYFWYDKNAKQIRKLRFSASSVEDALKLTRDDETRLSFSSYRFNDEDNLFRFFQAYLQG